MRTPASCCVALATSWPFGAPRSFELYALTPSQCTCEQAMERNHTPGANAHRLVAKTEMGIGRKRSLLQADVLFPVLVVGIALLRSALEPKSKGAFAFARSLATGCYWQKQAEAQEPSRLTRRKRLPCELHAVQEAVPTSRNQPERIRTPCSVKPWRCSLESAAFLQRKNRGKQTNKVTKRHRPLQGEKAGCQPSFLHVRKESASFVLPNAALSISSRLGCAHHPANAGGVASQRSTTP